MVCCISEVRLEPMLAHPETYMSGLTESIDNRRVKDLLV